MNPIVEKFIAGQLPEALVDTLMAGNLPVPPLDLLQALAHAVFQETAQGPRALATLQAMPESFLANAIVGPVRPADPLGLILIHRKEPGLLETALLHEDITAEWIERAVPELPGALLEIPLNNQVLWLERPAILDLLEAHPEAEYHIKRRVNEFRRDVLRLIPEEVAQERLEVIDEVEAGRLDRAWSELPLPKETPQEEPAAELTPERLHRDVVTETGEEIPLRLTQRVMKLRTNQKIMLAIKGGKEERTLLIREANRLIQVNVVRNGRITEGEVAFIAQMRTISDEVIRIIAANRDWMKKYTILKNIVMNPKTPLALSLNFFKRLIDLDLKILVRDKNVPEILRREAKRYLAIKALH
ncbi:MAG: hypothetical protein P4L36_14645 [Holophaga sp.]|nr:hypothetical protein [Holophaga sp.]